MDRDAIEPRTDLAGTAVSPTGGAPALDVGEQQPTGGFTSLDGEEFYRISAYHRMLPFLMSVASDSDLWMFVSSTGGLTAGRVDADGSLFPYETVDKLHDGHHHTGPVTLLRVRRPDRPETLWQPFSQRSLEGFRIERNLYKNTTGNRLVFEEINHDLALVFRYRWSSSDELGHVRTSWLDNSGEGAVGVSVLDGLRNILPYGAPLALYQQSSSLVDAYKRTDCDGETRLGIFSLTSKIMDRAEAAEELRANTVWSHGLPDFEVSLSGEALDQFRRGDPIPGDRVLTGRRGCYLVVSSLELEPGEHAKWHMVSDVGRSHVQIAVLSERLRKGGDLDGEIEGGLSNARENLRLIVGSADGLQLTGDAEASVHHFANVLFNSMRGGVFAKDYDIPTADFQDFLRVRNGPVARRYREKVQSLPSEVSLKDLLHEMDAVGDADLQRLCHEYLPMHFGRRHGDPSRPWNRFTIRARNADGGRALLYEGNWRDIFQNWEALGLSFPGFLPSFIAKFVNASTVDGFNPYRINRDGIDWEIVDPDDAWSYIGYWGDHQIIYLLKFLETLPKFSPGALETLLEKEIFCYANVPYRLKPYEEILEDPDATIVFDNDLAARIEHRVASIGTDGKLVPDGNGSIYHVNLLEKLLVPALSKLSNLVPDGGIWMNTQRPEWNDANNALVGRGISMVTLYHLRRYLGFLQQLLKPLGDEVSSISTEIVRWFRRLHSILDERRCLLKSETLSDTDRKELLDALGEAFSDYREDVYSNGFSGKELLAVPEIVSLCRCAMDYLDHAIRANRRADGLYHAYNLLEISGDGQGATVCCLYEMLEGQVAALSSGFVEASEAVRLLSSLFGSSLYREDQKSFLLYPERDLPSFLERNVIPHERVLAIPILTELVEAGEISVLARDAEGRYRFHGDFKNARDLAARLDQLADTEPWGERVEADRQAVLDAFEEVFDHRSFTGRSGTMYGYEGLGCVYWHMVSKLLLAVQEMVLRAAREGVPARVREDLAKTYYLIRAGLGFEKNVSEYGAFPTDPYSHTPSYGGARQPGMTGQVKEEILTRLGELGVCLEEGTVSFRPALLRRKEFLRKAETYRYYDVQGKLRTIGLPAGSLAFTFCQVPVIYTLTRNETWIGVAEGLNESTVQEGDRLDASKSRTLFDRAGVISRIDVGVPEHSLCQT